MIHLPLIRHIRRFCASLVMFGTSIFVMLYCPSRYTYSNEGVSHVRDQYIRYALLSSVHPGIHTVMKVLYMFGTSIFFNLHVITSIQVYIQ